jgi:hypothetical protein
MDQATSVEPTASVDAEAVAKQTQDQERQRMTALQTEFPDDPAFAMEQFTAGATVTEAKAAYCDKLRAEKQARDDQTSDGAEPIPFSASGDEATGDFMAEARQRSCSMKISMTEAMRQVSGEKPDLYQSFQSGQERKKLTIKGGGKRRI